MICKNKDGYYSELIRSTWKCIQLLTIRSYIFNVADYNADYDTDDETDADVENDE